MVLTYKTEFINVQNFSSWEEDRKAWIKPLYRSQEERVLKYPNYPHQTDVYYDVPDLAATAAASPQRYHVMSSEDKRWVSKLSMQAGDPRFLKNVPPYSANLGPGAYHHSDSGAPKADHQGTSSFHAPMRKYPPPVEIPDTSNANLDLDKKEWHRKGATVSRSARVTDPSLWRYGQSRAVMPRRNQKDLQYDVRTVLDGSPSSLFGQVCASPRRLKASFASSTAKMEPLPLARSADARTLRGTGSAPAGGAGKVWDGNNWVVPAQAARAGVRQRCSQGMSQSMDLGRLRKPVSADGLHLFTAIRSDLKSGSGGTSMRGQGHFGGPNSRSMQLDSSLRSRR